MINYKQGNLLDAQVDALVNTVNEVGVMGKGIALMIREAFPDNARAYEAACKRGEVKVGTMHVTRTGNLMGPKWIVNFPTKKHWRHPSRLEWIRSGLKDLVRVIRKEKIGSIALPPLGCGNGGLEWLQVRQEIQAELAGLKNVEIIVFEPIDAYQNAAKRAGAETLTLARALIAELVRQYASLGIECTNLEIQKLAWLLHRALNLLGMSDPLDLHFVAHRYGPYADNLRHLLNGLDGSYLHCEKRLSDAGPLDTIWFEYSRKESVKSFLHSDAAKAYLPALEKTSQMIDGFESPLGMELLATVDWLLLNGKCQPTTSSIRDGLKTWPGGKTAGQRKNKLFNDTMIGLALERIAETVH